MKTFSIFHPLFMSFYSKSLYRDVAKNWTGIAALYLFILLAIVWIPGIMEFTFNLRLFAYENGPSWIQQVPTITIKEGLVSIDKPEPYFIKNPKTGEVAAIFDDTGHYTNLDKTTASVLVTHTQIITRKNQQETRIYNLTKADNYVITQAKLHTYLHALFWWAPIIVFITVVVSSFVYRLIQALLYGLVGYIYSRFIKYDVTYHATYRLTIVALTPTIIISSVLGYLHVLFPFEWLLYLLIGLGYVIFAVRVSKE